MKRSTEKWKACLNKESVAGVVFTLPFILGFLLFMLVPMGISLYYSFCDYNILSPPVFTGFKNYINMFHDETFFKAIGVTFYYALVSVPLRLIFALMVAMILLKTTKASGFYRAAYYLPSIIGGSVAVSILWKRMFAIDGVVNKLLSVFGLEEGISWLGNTKTAIWTLIILAVWQFGSSMLVFLSSLKQIPATLYEAAAYPDNFLQSCNADDQRIPCIYTMLYHYTGKTHEFYTVLHGIYVPAVIRVLQYQLRSCAGMGNAGNRRIDDAVPVRNKAVLGI